MSFFDFFKKKKADNSLADTFDIIDRKNTVAVPSSKTKEKKCIDVLKALSRNSIVMMPKQKGTVEHPSDSKIGGKPYLPADFTWPTYTDKEDNVTRPLSFFCQIKLSEIKPYDKEGLLPERGHLYFFYECESMRWGFDPEDKGAARVFYYDTTDVIGIAPFDIPEDINEEYVIPEMPLKFKCEKSYPDLEELEYYGVDDGMCDDYDDALEKLGVDFDEDDGEHKLLGYANVIQGEMLTEAERVSRALYCGDPESYNNTPKDVEEDITRHAADWMLLCQLSTVEKGDFEFMFGDCGMLYFYIKKQDLKNMNFDNVHFSVQCG